MLKTFEIRRKIMFEINYMSGNKRAFKDIESEKGKLGTQSRIYD